MTELPQYHFDRQDFVRVWDKVLSDKTFDVLDLCVAHHCTANFELWCDADEEYYIRHNPTGITINWYKGAHLGRTNTCTDPAFDLEDFEKFLVMLRSELGEDD